jgi:hypothetical protein
MLADLAKAYNEGRLLLLARAISTRSRVIWNIGAIAASGHPRARDTIGRILLASPRYRRISTDYVRCDVDGKPYQEMHVDGGAFAQAFLYPRR